MNRKCRSTLFRMLILLSTAPNLVWAQAEHRQAKVSGYFSQLGAPDLSNVIPPAPQTGDSRDSNDRAVFVATRAFQGTPRWTLASNDNVLSVSGLLQDFSCATGFTMRASDMPKLSALIAHVSVDSNSIDGTIKDQYQRKRPFLIQDGPICIDRSPGLINSFDYPSGHTTLGWLTGLILADLLPNRAGAILIRARAFGESRIICGVHNASAVEGGRTLGSAVFAALSGVAAFQKDMEEAKAEVVQLAAKGVAVDGAVCSTEKTLTAVSPYAPVEKR